MWLTDRDGARSARQAEVEKMIELQVAEQARELLSVAIATVIEDVHDLAVSVHVEGSPDPDGVLRAAGEDVVALAAAMEVLRRRAGVVEG